MGDSCLFTWRHFEADIILCAVWWYLRDALSDRDVEELLRERSVCGATTPRCVAGSNAMHQR